mgnify:CR=1 FL=1
MLPAPTALLPGLGEEILYRGLLFGVLFRLAQSWVQRGMKDSLTKQANVLFEMLWRAIAKPG